MDIGYWYADYPLSNMFINKLNSELSSGRWVIGGTKKTLNIYAPGHAIVIKSYDEDNECYTFWDPWTNGENSFYLSELQNQAIYLDGDSECSMLGFIVYGG